MNNGFLKIACGIPDIKVADCEYNAKNITDLIVKAEKEGVKIISFPELSITGATCGDLFFQRTLIDSARENLLKIAKETETTISEITRNLLDKFLKEKEVIKIVLK